MGWGRQRPLFAMPDEQPFVKTEQAAHRAAEPAGLNGCVFAARFFVPKGGASAPTSGCRNRRYSARVAATRYSCRGAAVPEGGALAPTSGCRNRRYSARVAATRHSCRGAAGERKERCFMIENMIVNRNFSFNHLQNRLYKRSKRIEHRKLYDPCPE